MDKIVAQYFYFGFVKLSEEGRNWIGCEHCPQTGQQRGQLGTDFGQLLDSLVRRRQPRLQFQVENVTFRVNPLRRRVSAGMRLDLRLNCHAVEQLPRIPFAGDNRRTETLRSRGRGDSYLRPRYVSQSCQ